ncbi:hypothetical protein M422DRAFT_253874 [Sphaerobolus stellatus SS14]|uniref:Uncharacterized protein n=1 Tax=Sphaerobolus stellatus (strain SS14) TaxID=990650 RepID=A0A0C9VLX6_SPHS4|nr:hypothetical protein M422DRAFT_253874 [Sphaerobolus stellatus SS14]
MIPETIGNSADTSVHGGSAPTGTPGNSSGAPPSNTSSSMLPNALPSIEEQKAELHGQLTGLTKELMTFFQMAATLPLAAPPVPPWTTTPVLPPPPPPPPPVPLFQHPVGQQLTGQHTPYGLQQPQMYAPQAQLEHTAFVPPVT